MASVSARGSADMIPVTRVASQSFQERLEFSISRVEASQLTITTLITKAHTRLRAIIVLFYQPVSGAHLCPAFTRLPQPSYLAYAEAC